MANSIPFNQGATGSYSYGGRTGIIPAALTANSEIYQFRWIPAVTTRLAVIRRIRISAAVSTTFFAAGVPLQIDLIKSVGWSAVGTGGTGIDPSTFLKRRTDFLSSGLVASDMRIATTAALGAGTKTLESLSLSSIVAGGPITASLNGTIFPTTDLWRPDASDGDTPLILKTGEGFSIVVVAVPGTGTWTAGINVDWIEVTDY